MNKTVTVRATLRLFRNDKLFGPGVARLLEHIEQLGSLRRSAAEMNMSYSKAWTILRECEAQLGFPLLERKTGGAKGGGASLTPQGREMLTRYQAFETQAHATLDALAEQHFGDFLRAQSSNQGENEL